MFVYFFILVLGLYLRLGNICLSLFLGVFFCCLCFFRCPKSYLSFWSSDQFGFFLGIVWKFMFSVPVFLFSELFGLKLGLLIGSVFSGFFRCSCKLNFVRTLMWIRVGFIFVLVSGLWTKRGPSQWYSWFYWFIYWYHVYFVFWVGVVIFCFAQLP